MEKELSQNYIFGYGSLISSESRLKTGESGKTTICYARGIKRSWNFVVPRDNNTALGAVYDEEAECNGVLIPIPEIELPKYDAREVGYSRQLIESDAIRLTNNHDVPPAIWVYLLNTPGQPSSENPIIQSYLDVVLTGCFEVGGEQLARDFIALTHGWSVNWINDRQNPRYPRAMENVFLKNEIDEILNQTIPEYFNKRQKV